MIWPFTRGAGISDGVYALYNSIVAQSRRPVFYAEWDVPDTVTGRFDMISLHLCLVLIRLRRENAARDTAQSLFDLFFKDMDRSLREMGVGDLGVPKKIEKMGSAFYGLLDKLAAALEAGEKGAVAEVVRRNVYDGGASPFAAILADYLVTQSAALAARPLDEVLAAAALWKETP